MFRDNSVLGMGRGVNLAALSTASAPVRRSPLDGYLTGASYVGMGTRKRESTMPRRPIAFALLLWYLPACTAWHVQKGVSPEQLIATKHPNSIRVTRPDSSTIVLHQPRIAAGDSLSGLHNGAPSSVALSDVTQVAIREFSAGKTIGLVVGISVVAAAIAVVAIASAFEGCTALGC